MTLEEINQIEKDYRKRVKRTNSTYVKSVLDRMARERVKLRSESNDKFHSSDSSFNAHTCGTIQNRTTITGRDIGILEQEVNDIMREVEANPNKYDPVCESYTELNTTRGGEGKLRDIEGGVGLVEIGMPQWIKDLKIAFQTYSRTERKRGKDWFDVEDLTFYGTETRESAKKRKPINEVYTMIDVSGSMGAFGKSGKTYLELMASYLPHIVSKYDGEVWIVDEQIQGKWENNRLRTAFDKAEKEARSKTLGATASGNSDFDKAFVEFLAIKKQEKKDFMLLILTDGQEPWNYELLKELGNVTFVLPKEGNSGLAHYNIDKLIEDEELPHFTAINVDWEQID